MVCKINTELDVPIYKQLVDSICAAIKSGELPSGSKLPTVQEMTEELGIARGTVKRAYDELEITGLIEKVQGRGTFVKYHKTNSGSRKEQAMEAIDDLLERLENMGFSMAEINIFLSLKIRERSEEEAHIKVAVVECNHENLSQMSEQLRHIDGLDLYSYTLESIEQYPYKLGEDFELIVTTATHAQHLAKIVPGGKRIARVALRPSARYLSHIIKLRKGAKVGIVGYSERFAELIYNTCEMYAEDAVIERPVVVSGDADITHYMKDKDVILVPKYCEKYFGADVMKALGKFRGDIIDCNYEMDEGSILYLESKIKKLRDEKQV